MCALENPLGETTLDARFWSAFTAYVEELIEQGELDAAFGFQGKCGNLGGCNAAALSRAVKQQLGRLGWPIHPEITLTQDEMIRLVEFFHSVVASRTDTKLCSYCETYHIFEADEERGRTNYTQGVNDLFRRFGTAFLLHRGSVRRVRSHVLYKNVVAPDLQANDKHLANLLSRAVDDFFNPREDRRVTALQGLVDAFERIKSSQARDKKESVQQLIAKISPAGRFIPLFDQLYREHTKLANEYTIRHHEVGTKPLTNELVTEFLFFSYYNLIRLALRSLEI